MYKILINQRFGSKPLWNFYQENKEVVVTEEVTDELTGDVITPAVTEVQLGDYETDDLDTLEKKIIELLATYTTSQLRVIHDMTYELDILFNS